MAAHVVAVSGMAGALHVGTCRAVLYRPYSMVQGTVPGRTVQRCPGKLHPQLRGPLVQAFKSYDEAGVPRRIHCLKYLVPGQHAHGQPG